MVDFIVQTDARHEEMYQDLIALIRKYAQEDNAEEMLAISANIVGKIIAMQNQRTMSSKRALDIVTKNIVLGNEQILDGLHVPKGNA